MIFFVKSKNFIFILVAVVALNVFATDNVKYCFKKKYNKIIIKTEVQLRELLGGSYSIDKGLKLREQIRKKLKVLENISYSDVDCWECECSDKYRSYIMSVYAGVSMYIAREDNSIKLLKNGYNALNDALALDSQNLKAYYGLGLFYIKLSQRTWLVRNIIQEYLEIDDIETEISNFLNRLYLDKNDSAEMNMAYIKLLHKMENIK